MADFNDQQLQVIVSKSPRIMCLAGAGAGKTRTLLGRITHLIETGVDPTSILALTFTNAAAFEMKERYKRLGVDLSRGVPEFRTFHSFCYSLIIKDKSVREKLGYTQIPQVCDDDEFKEIKTRIKLQLNSKLTEEQMEGKNLYTRAQQDQYALFKKALIKELKTQNVITFDIMCYNVCELFERDLDEVKKYKDKYKYLFVDEYQDCDARQNKFVVSFPESTNVALFADALQNIYQFRDCTNKYVKEFAESPAWEVIKLYENYRSTTNICDFANKFSKSYSSDKYRIEMHGQRPGQDPKIIWGSHATMTEPVDTYHLSLLVDMIKQNPGECAVLCRSNREVAAVRRALADNEIQFSTKSKSTDNLSILESALSNEYAFGWLASKLEAKDYGDYIRLSALADKPDLHWFLDNYGNREVIRKITEKISCIRTIATSDFTQREKFDMITKELRVKTKCKFNGDDNISNRDLINDIKNQVQSLEECDVYCGTIHSVKGLEYDTVYVMGVDDRFFRLDSEEMYNLYYVAVTRPKEHLVVFRR